MTVPGAASIPFFDQEEVYADAMMAFMRSVEDEEHALDRVLATVLFTDIVGSTEEACKLGDARWKQLLARHNERVRAMLARYRGVEVDTAGDGFLATFDGPARAVKCAQGICEAVRPLGLEVRAGCHTGEIELMGDDVGGIAVHIGARVSALAGPSEVLVSVHGEGPGGRVRPHLRGPRRARAQGRAREVAAVRGSGLSGRALARFILTGGGA